MTADLQMLLAREELQGLGDLDKLKAILSKIAFLKENKWLKDQGLISRYKSRRSLEQFSSAGYRKIVFNMVKAAITPLFADLPWNPHIRKDGNAGLRIVFDDGLGYQSYTRNEGSHSQRRLLELDLSSAMRDALARHNVDASRLNRNQFETYSLRSYGHMTLRLLYDDIALLGTANQKTLGEYQASVSLLAGILREGFIRTAAPLPAPATDEYAEASAEDAAGATVVIAAVIEF